LKDLKHWKVGKQTGNEDCNGDEAGRRISPW